MKKLKLTTQEYNEAKGLRSSDIKRILANPYAYKINADKKGSVNLNKGSYAHALLFEPETIKSDFGIYSGGKGVTEKVKEIESQGLIPILDSDLSTITQAIDNLKNSEAYALFKNCEYEVSCFSEYKDLTLKCKIDALGKDYIIDLKTTSIRNGASYNEFSKSCANYGYYIQAAHYMRITGIKKFLFVVVELVEPYMIGLYTLDNASIDFGIDEIERAIDIYKNLDKYKGIYLDNVDYSKVQTITLPNYVFYKR